MDLASVAEEFALNVAAQTDAIWHGDRKGGIKHAKRYIAAYKKLRDHGEAGWNALAALLTHPRADVRVNAAICLLSDRPTQARPVLEEAAKGEGMTSFVAAQALKHWEAGTWRLDVD